MSMQWRGGNHIVPAEYANDDPEEDNRFEYEIAEEKWPRCSCLFCDCLEHTEYGEVCDDCRYGAHQG